MEKSVYECKSIYFSRAFVVFFFFCSLFISLVGFYRWLFFCCFVAAVDSLSQTRTVRVNYNTFKYKLNKTRIHGNGLLNISQKWNVFFRFFILLPISCIDTHHFIHRSLQLNAQHFFVQIRTFFWFIWWYCPFGRKIFCSNEKKW